jgi:hypothetical protein
MKLDNMMIRENDESGDDFDVVFIDFGSGQAGNSFSIQLIDGFTSASCIMPNLMFGDAAELCSQSRDVFALSLQQLESFTHEMVPAQDGLLKHIYEDLLGKGMDFAEFHTFMMVYWLSKGVLKKSDCLFVNDNGLIGLSDEGKEVAGLAYAYLVLMHMENRDVMKSMEHMW